MQLLIWKKAMLYFIFISFAELSGTGRERKIQNENILSQAGFEPATMTLKANPGPLTARSPDWYIKLCLKVF